MGLSDPPTTNPRQEAIEAASTAIYEEFDRRPHAGFKWAAQEAVDAAWPIFVAFVLSDEAIERAADTFLGCDAEDGQPNRDAKQIIMAALGLGGDVTGEPVES